MPATSTEMVPEANIHAGTAAHGCPAERGLRGWGAVSTEWSILLTACSALPSSEKRARLLPLLQQLVRWDKLLALAAHHGTQPLLCRALSGLEEAIPPEQLHSLSQISRANLHKALLLSRELIRIVRRLSALGIEVMPYKGPALAELLYADIAQRQSGDIDLLIHPQDLSRIRQAVRELGYTPHEQFSPIEERAYMKSGYEYVFDGAAGPNLLELQWAIEPRFYAVDFDMDGVFQRAVTVPVAGHPMKTPSPADLHLILSVHAGKHAWERLAWLCDISQLMNLPGLDWNWIASQARDLGIVRIVRVTMLAANQWLGAAIPKAADKSLPEDPSAPAMVEKIRDHFVSESAVPVESLAYFRLMMRLRERLRDRRRFLTRLLFTPGPGEWAAVRLPRPLFPLYPLVRLSRLAARVVRS